MLSILWKNARKEVQVTVFSYVCEHRYNLGPSNQNRFLSNINEVWNGMKHTYWTPKFWTVSFSKYIKVRKYVPEPNLSSKMTSANVVPITASKINEYFIVCVFLVPICNEIRVGYQILIRHYIFVYNVAQASRQVVAHYSCIG